MGTSRPVIVKRMPDRINLQQSRDFLREVQPLLRSDRPQVVFDFSAVRRMDAAGVDMLLQCMSDVMKHDGDLKLAALSPQAGVVLELTRADRLFEVYNTVSDAVRSFSGFLPNAMRNYAEWGVEAAAAAVESGGDGSPKLAA